MLEKEKTPHKLGGFVTLLCIRINLTCIKKLTKNKNYSIIWTRYVLRRISVKEDKAYKIRKTFIVITLILLFATAGLFVISANVKTVTIDYYGQKTSVKTLASTVDGFLLQNKVYVNDNSTIEPSRENKIEDGIEIKVYSNNELAKFDENEVRKEYTPMIAKLEDVEESIPFEEQKNDNSNIDVGTENVVQEGEEGKKLTKYLVRYNQNSEIYRAELSSNVISEAKNRVVEVGTRYNLASRSSSVNIPTSIVTDGGFKQYNIGLPVEQQKYAYNLCQQYGVQYELFLAVMYKESGFNSNAVGGGNSYGLCQIHISNQSNLSRKLGITNLLDPYDNMTAGVYLLANYINSARSKVSGDAVEVYGLNAYNMGEDAYYNSCYSQGILNRGYSNSVISIKNALINNGGL